MDPPMDLPSIHSVDPQLLIPALKSHLPYSLPLLRRLQHSLVHASPTAKCLATAGALKPESDSVSGSSVSGESLPGDAWLAAWVDLHAGPETQVVVYSNLEVEMEVEAEAEAQVQAQAAKQNMIKDSDSPRVSTLSPTSTRSVRRRNRSSRISPDTLDRVRAQLLALLSHIQHRLMPEYLQSLDPAPEPGRDANSNTKQAGNRPGGAGNDSSGANPPGQPFGPRAFKIGHLHTGLFSALTASGQYPPFLLSPASAVPSSNSNQTLGPGPIPNPSSLQMVVPGLRVHRFDQPPYNKYLFQDEAFVIAKSDPDGDHGDVIQYSGPRSRSTGPPPAVISPVSHEPNSNSFSSSSCWRLLPPGYRFSDRKGSSALLPRHYELICRRSAVFRTPKSLASFSGVAVYVDTPSSSPSSFPSDTEKVNSDGDDEDPVAWAFLSADGTLAVLHVEPEHRGKGLAEAASREVMRRGMREGGTFRAKGEKGWVHADVAPTNRASCRVMEKLGGVVGWMVTWTVLEFDG